MLRIPSSDGVSVAVHELAGSEAPDHPIVLIAHATGFHGRAYLPVAEHLAPTFHVFGMDARGHGDTELADRAVDWERYGEDTAVVAEHLTATARWAARSGRLRSLQGGDRAADGRRPPPRAVPPPRPVRADRRPARTPRHTGRAECTHRGRPPSPGDVPVDRGRHRQLRVEAAARRLRPGRPRRLRPLRLQARPGGCAPEVRPRGRGQHVRAGGPPRHVGAAGGDRDRRSSWSPVASSRRDRRCSPRPSPTSSPTVGSCSTRRSTTSAPSPNRAASHH